MERNKFELPPLRYKLNALAPTLSQETIELHWGKHLQGYVNNLNQLIEGTPLVGESLEAVVKHSDGAIFNNAAQVWNHHLYFDTLSPTPKPAPSGALAEAIIAQYGSLDSLKSHMEQLGTTLFGSGWVWLSMDDHKKLTLTAEANAGNPLTQGLTPLLTLDVWEHAYYVDYRNRRAEYLTALWQLIDWAVVEERYSKEV